MSFYHAQLNGDYLNVFYRPLNEHRCGLAQIGHSRGERAARSEDPHARGAEQNRRTIAVEREGRSACQPRLTTASMPPRGPLCARSVAAVCGRASCALSAVLLLSLPAGASSSSSSTLGGSRGAVSELAFCAPLSPRCFPGRAAAREQGAGRRRGHIQAVIDNADEASQVSTPRKHLGPTAEEIVAQRRQEALARKSEVLSSWRCDSCPFARPGPCCWRYCACASARAHNNAIHLIRALVLCTQPGRGDKQRRH